MGIEGDGNGTPIERADAVLAAQGYEWDEDAEEWRRADGAVIPLDEVVRPGGGSGSDQRRPDGPIEE